MDATYFVSIRIIQEFTNASRIQSKSHREQRRQLEATILASERKEKMQTRTLEAAVEAAGKVGNHLASQVVEQAALTEQLLTAARPMFLASMAAKRMIFMSFRTLEWKKESRLAMEWLLWTQFMSASIIVLNAIPHMIAKNALLTISCMITSATRLAQMELETWEHSAKNAPCMIAASALLPLILAMFA